MRTLQRTLKLKSFTFVFVFVIVALGLMTSPAGAAVVYSYTGNNFTSISNSTSPAGTYDTTMRVTGSFTVAAPLAPLTLFTDISASVSSYSFNDGRQTLDNGNSIFNVSLIRMGDAGIPIRWQLHFFSPSPVLVGEIKRDINTILSPMEAIDQGSLAVCTAILVEPACEPGGDSATSFTAGTWTVTPAVVPLPPAVLLFGSGLVALFGFARAGGHRLRRG